MRTTKTLTWTITWEEMDGHRRTTKVKATSLGRAIDVLCTEHRVGNVLKAEQGRVRYL